MFAVKRLIGRQFNDDVVQDDIEKAPYSITKAENGDAWVEVKGEKMAPPQISAQVLTKMRKTAEDYLGEEVTEASEIQPAMQRAREAIAKTGKCAVVNVWVDPNEYAPGTKAQTMYK